MSTGRSPMMKSRFLPGNKGMSVAIIAMMLVIASSNYLVQIEINKWLTWGAFTYPFSFFITEIINRFYGPKKARQVVYIGFTIAVALGLMFMNQQIAFASSVAFLASQLLDIGIFNQLRKARWWLAPGVASLLASFVDTLIFFYLAFYGQEVSWLQLGFGDLGIKLLMDLLLLLPFRMALNWDAVPPSSKNLLNPI
jgi:queuosine precursor transporter